MINISRTIILLSLVFSVISCDENPTQLGEDLLPPSDDFALAVDSSTVFTTSMITQADPAITHYVQFNYNYYIYIDPDSINLLGDYSDISANHILGNKKADLLLRLLPPYEWTKAFPANSHVDSLILYLKVDSVLAGSKGANMKYTIWDVNKYINYRDTFLTDNLASYKGSTQLGTGTSNLLADSIRIAINNNDLFQRLINVDSATLARDSIFTANILKGLYITVQKEGDEGAMIVLNTAESAYNSTKLTLYYNDSLYLNYYSRINFNGAFSFTSDLSNSIVSSENEHVFVQGLQGSYAQLELPNVAETWKDSGIVAINKAELFIYPDYDYLTSIGITSKKIPKRLDLFYNVVSSNGKSSKAYISSGTLIDGAYHFNVASYYQYLLRNKLSRSPLYIKDYNVLYSTGTVAFRKTGATKLKIIYSKIK
jgi:hypothetical protein